MKLIIDVVCVQSLKHEIIAVHENSEHKADYPTIMGFEPLVNQRLLPPTFPRYTKIKSRKETIEYLENLVKQLLNICKITKCTTFHSAIDFFLDFSKSGPCVLSRSILQIIYLPGYNKVYGNQPFTEVLKEAVRGFICPPSLANKAILTNHPQPREYLESFLSHCVRPFGTLIQITGHNRARQRDKVAHVLEDFAALQDEADKVDAFLHNYLMKSEFPRPHLACFGTWILYHTLRLMIQYLLSGFELELYSTHEYHYIYWYLHEFLYGWLVSAITRAESFLIEQETLLERETHKGRKKARSKKKRNRPYGREITMNQALQQMCGGYYKALVGFRMDQKVRLPCPEFDNEQVRYEHRFAPFASVITPPPVQYSQFQDMTDPSRFQNISGTIMYVNACKHFHQARGLLEMINTGDTEVANLVKVCKTNFIVMKLMAGGHKKESPVPPNFDFSLSKYFPVLKIPR